MDDNFKLYLIQGVTHLGAKNLRVSSGWANNRIVFVMHRQYYYYLSELWASEVRSKIPESRQPHRHTGPAGKLYLASTKMSPEIVSVWLLTFRDF